MFHIWRTASSRSFDWCAARRRRLQAAGASGAGRRAGRLLRAARPSGRACDILHHSMLALEPSMALASFSLVAYSCRCMRQLRWWRAAAMLASSGGPPPPPRVQQRAGRWRRWLVHQSRASSLRRPSPYRSATTPCPSPSTICERRLAPHSCPPRQLGAARSCTPGGARQGPVVSHVLQSAAPTGPSP